MVQMLVVVRNLHVCADMLNINNIVMFYIVHFCGCSDGGTLLRKVSVLLSQRSIEDLLY